MKKIGIFLSFLTASAIFLFLPQKVFGVTITINNFPSSISADAFNVGFSVAGPDPGTNYFRIDLFKEGTTDNYFGETYNGSGWYNGSSGNQYFPLTISPEGTVSGTIQGKVGTPNSSDYPGSGTYKLRIRRYTGSGNPATSDQTPVDLQINVLFATPTPTPTPTDEPDPTNTPTPTPSLTPTPTSTPTPTKKPTPTLTPTPEVSNSGEVLLETDILPTPTINNEQPQVLGSEKTHDGKTNLPYIFIGLGLLLILVSLGALLIPKLRYNKTNEPKITELS